MKHEVGARGKIHEFVGDGAWCAVSDDGGTVALDRKEVSCAEGFVMADLKETACVDDRPVQGRVVAT